MDKKQKWHLPSVGSDETNTGGLLGGAVYAAVRITNETSFEITEGKLKQIWEGKEREEKDPRNWKPEDIEKAANLIRKVIPNEDIFIWKMKINSWNSKRKEYKNLKEFEKYEIKKIINCIAHNFIHFQLTNNYTAHIIDDFLLRDKKLWKIIQEKIKRKAPMPCWQKGGEENWCSVNIAAILATYENQKYFFHLIKTLGLSEEEISIEDNHFYQKKKEELEFPERLEKIEKVLQKFIKEKRKELIDIHCKHNLLEKIRELSKNQEIIKIIDEILKL